MSYELFVWDAARHAPVPTSSEEALQAVERLGDAVGLTVDPKLKVFADRLVARCEADSVLMNTPGEPMLFWGGDLRSALAQSRASVLRLSLPEGDEDDYTRRIAYAVDAAAELGLVVLDDETGMCFLPDGRIFPEDCREMWEFNRAELIAPSDSQREKGSDGRTLLERLGGELWDAVGRDN
ncbi:MAG: hypothetical protein ABI564_07215 [Ideonella sp.]